MNEIKYGMLFQDKNGKIMHSDEVDELSAWEIDELGISVFDDNS